MVKVYFLRCAFPGAVPCWIALWRERSGDSVVCGDTIVASIFPTLYTTEIELRKWLGKASFRASVVSIRALIEGEPRPYLERLRVSICVLSSTKNMKKKNKTIFIALFIYLFFSVSTRRDVSSRGKEQRLSSKVDALLVEAGEESEEVVDVELRGTLLEEIVLLQNLDHLRLQVEALRQFLNVCAHMRAIVRHDTHDTHTTPTQHTHTHTRRTHDTDTTHTHDMNKTSSYVPRC